jgi:transcriptional regulator with XRE-family HTH domain
MEKRHHWQPPLNGRADIDVEVIVESSLAMAQAAIQKVMKDSNVRKIELAARLGRPRSFISKMLSGSHNLTVKTLARALAVCGYELTWEYQPIEWGWVKEPAVVYDGNAFELEAASAAFLF